MFYIMLGGCMNIAGEIRNQNDVSLPVLVITVYLVFDVDDSILHLLTLNLRMLCLKEIPGDYVGMTISCLKGALPLL